MTTSFQPNAEQTQIIVSAQQAQFSKSTVAQLNETADRLKDVKKSMLDDMSNGAFDTPQQALNASVELQGVQNKINALKTQIEGNISKDFSEKDIETIESMKKRGLTEEKIAEHFGTNQTKINRLRNGKI